MKEVSYNRKAVLEYASKWAFLRNPAFYNFDGIGGDCTNFASQCIYAGCKVMNYTKDTGWYFNSSNDRAPAWSSVEHLHTFLLNNKSVGPSGIIVNVFDLQIGDIVFLNNGIYFYHTLVVTGFADNVPLVSAHTFDAHLRRLDSYVYSYAEGVHIDKVLKW